MASTHCCPSPHRSALACINTVIRKKSAALKKHPHPGQKRAWLLKELGSALRDRFDETEDLLDIDTAIEVHRQSLTAVESNHPLRPSLLSHYGFALHDRFDHSENLRDLEDALSQHRQALELLPAGDPDQYDVLCNVCNALQCRFLATGEGSDLDEAVVLSRKALQLRPTSRDSYQLLGDLLLQRFQASRQQRDLDEAIEVNQQCLDLRPDDPERARIVNALAATLLRISLETEEGLPILEKAISLLQHARDLPLQPSGASLVQVNLAICLKSRYKWLATRQDLEEAEKLCRETLRRSESSAIRQAALENLASILIHQFQTSYQLHKLDEAISLLHAYISSTDVDHHPQASMLRHLASALQFRYSSSTKTNARGLDEAILLLRKAMLLSPPTSPHRYLVASSLALALSQRFHNTRGKDSGRGVSFLEEAIQLQSEVVSAMGHSHPDRREAVAILAHVTEEKYNHSRKLEDLDEAIALRREALSLTRLQHRNPTGLLNNLAHTLQKRYDHHHFPEDLTSAISVCREACIEPSSSTFMTLSLLGKLLCQQYDLTRQPGDLYEAMEAFPAAVADESESVAQRFFVAQKWAHWADGCGHKSALDAYGAAIGFLPSLAMLGQDLSSRQSALTSGTDGLAREAAAVAIREGKFERAVELLEEGRAVFWSQALQLRTSFDDLRLKAPELADQLQTISQKMEQDSYRGADKVTMGSYDVGLAAVSETQSRHLRLLGDQWRACLQEVRGMEGFEGFLLPKAYPDLRHVAAHGPVVILNATDSRFDALIIKAPGTEVLHVPLTGFNADTQQQLAKMRALCEDACPLSCGDRGMRWKDKVKSPETIMKEGLAKLWETVVEPIIRALDLKRSASPPRLWWCPTGSFSSLPIHAAGIYDSPEGESVSDYVVSSFIPTLTTLLRDAPPKVDSFKMLVVIQPNSKGYRPIPNTEIELQNIENIVDDHVLVRYGLPGAPALVSSILSEIPSATILHFACHGIQDSADLLVDEEDRRSPLQSALILEDGPLNVTEIMKLSLKNESLVFLSACQTATGDQSLPDESMHLAATMLFAGFRGVVGTLWSIDDKDGPKVADTFYRHLFSPAGETSGSQATPDTAEAARALHIAVSKLREERCSFLRWVSFVHLGF
ncbi:hypothetical protein JAAARDRAFT_550455 [Jaapia argillacea MUCL 33604]|uniref:CHAT domain-containing protein n=1 Tax=Jaapia argillacea MUCL 33604 TaxID=933084 RepID=A0A067PA66_9AGAM|nr:hypothetical protein JAAARDRAFT_550455 [Jaapia argillacea MUCL 33604]